MRLTIWWIFPVTACVCVLFILMAPPSKPCQKHVRKPGTTNQTVPFVVILAAARSGSTWLESFFTENVEVLDFFEPLDERAFKKDEKAWESVEKLSRADWVNVKVEVLANECQCQFQGVRYPSLGAIPTWSKSMQKMQGYLDREGKVLPAYRKPKGTTLKASLKNKLPEDLRHAETWCRNVKLITAKVIRLYDLSQLAQLEDLGCKNFKVIHLVRDPRPIIQSRMSTFGELNTGNSVEKTASFQDEEILNVSRQLCESFVLSARVGLSPFFDGRYRVVKYEDLAHDPLDVVGQLYEWVGLEMTDEIREYIKTSSSGTVVEGKYEVIRNTAEVVNAWKKVMKPEHAKLVESQCQRMLTLFNYDSTMAGWSPF